MTMLPFEDDQVSLDGENTSDEPVTDAAGQVVTADDDDAPLSDADLAHAKHAAAVVTGQASVAPPPIEAAEPEKKKRRGGRRAKAVTFEAVPEPTESSVVASVGEPVPGTRNMQAFINGQPLTAESINRIASQIYNQAQPRNIDAAVQQIEDQLEQKIPGKVVDAGDFLSCPLHQLDLGPTNAARVAKDAAALTARMNTLAPTYPKNPKAFFNGVLAQIEKLKSGRGTSLELESGAEIIMSLSPRATKPALQQMFDF